MSLDGNFSLVRKSSAGRSIDPPTHDSDDNHLFLADDKVKAFVDSYNSIQKPLNLVSGKQL